MSETENEKASLVESSEGELSHYETSRMKLKYLVQKSERIKAMSVTLTSQLLPMNQIK